MAAAACPPPTRTEVLTQPPSPPLTVRLRPPEDAIDWLAGILDRFQACNDPLSTKLLKWGGKVLEVVPIGTASTLISDQQFRAAAEAHLRVLRNDILSDLPPSSEKVHDFASEMLRWLHAVDEQAEFPVAAAASTAVVAQGPGAMADLSVALLSGPEMDPETIKLIAYLQARGNHRIGQMRRTTLTLEGMAEQFAQTTAKTRKAIAELRVNLREERERAVAAVEDRIHELEAAQRERVEGFTTRTTLQEGQIDAQAKNIKWQQQQLEVRGREIRTLNEKNAHLAERCSALERRIRKIHTCVIL